LEAIYESLSQEDHDAAHGHGSDDAPVESCFLRDIADSKVAEYDHEHEEVVDGETVLDYVRGDELEAPLSTAHEIYEERGEECDEDPESGLRIREGQCCCRMELGA